MSLDRIQQLAKSIAEGAYAYDRMANEKEKTGNKKRIREIEIKLKKLKEYLLSLSTNLNVLIKEEEKNV